MLRKIALQYHTVKDVMKHYKVSRATAFRWMQQGYAVIREYPKAMPELDYRTIARRSAWYVCGRQRDIDLLHEAEQAALIGLWKEKDSIQAASSPEDYAHVVGRKMALNALKAWRKKTVSFDDWLPTYETDGAGTLDFDSNEYDACDRMQ